MINQQPHGVYKVFKKNGNIGMTVVYNHGERTGESFEYKDDSTLGLKYIYFRPCYSKVYKCSYQVQNFGNGRIIKEETYINGVKLERPLDSLELISIKQRNQLQ